MERETASYEYGMYPMGLTLIDGGIHVCMAAAGQEVELLLYGKGEEEPRMVVPFDKGERIGDVWSVTVWGTEFEDLEYCFRIDGKEYPDPYGRDFCGRETWGELEHVHRPMRSPIRRCQFDWEGDRPLEIPYEDTIIYRAHVRGMTEHNSSHLKSRGTFAALIHKIPYMKNLGITMLELMTPVEFEEVMMPGGVDGNPYGKEEPTGKINYWGYGPALYFAPKKSYSVQNGQTPGEEFKTLVRELHKAEIEIAIELYFNGKESPGLVMDILRFWVMEYHVDGIHLVGYAPAALIGDDAYLRGTKLFANSWEGVPGGSRKHLGEYNDGFQIDMRRLLKGDEDQINPLIQRNRRNPKDRAVVNYMANTNGFTLMDMVSYDIKHNEDNGEKNQDGNDYNYSWNCGVEGPTKKKKILELRRRQLRNAYLLILLSQGTPLILAGDEFGNSKNGNNNSYCQDNEISWLNWNQLKSNQDIHAFVKHAIAFRRNHSVFHMPQEPMVMDYLACGHPDLSYHGVRAWCPEFENFRRQLGIMYCGEYGHKSDGTADDYFFVAYNMHWEPHIFSLPNLPPNRTWYLSMNTYLQEINGFYEEGQEPVLEDQKSYEIPPRTIAVFVGKKDPDWEKQQEKRLRRHRKKRRVSAERVAENTRENVNGQADEIQSGSMDADKTIQEETEDQKSDFQGER